MQKKTIFIILGVIAAAAVAYYFLIHKKKAPANAVSNNQPAPSISSMAASQVSQQAATPAPTMTATLPQQFSQAAAKILGANPGLSTTTTTASNPGTF